MPMLDGNHSLKKGKSIMTKLVPPHGAGLLKPLLIPEDLRSQALSKAEKLTKIPMSSCEVCDLLLLSMGAYTPLDGFMVEADWQGVCDGMKLQDGVFWPRRMVNRWEITN